MPKQLQSIIQSNEDRIRTLFSNGYREIYRRVHCQLMSFIRRNPVLNCTTLSIPTYPVLGVAIPSQEAKQYVRLQLQKEGVAVIGEDANSFLVQWTPNLSIGSQQKQKHSLKKRRRPHKKKAEKTSATSSSSPADSSSSSDSELEQQQQQPLVKPKLKMAPLIPKIHVPIPKTKAVSKSSSSSTKPASSAAAAVRTPNTQLSKKMEDKIKRLHMNVLKAMSGC